MFVLYADWYLHGGKIFPTEHVKKSIFV